MPRTARRRGQGRAARRLALVPDLAAAGQYGRPQSPSRSQVNFSVERLLLDFEFSELRDRARCKAVACLELPPVGNASLGAIQTAQ